MTTSSNFLTLNSCDFLKGLVLAAITAPLTIIQNSLAAGQLDFNWKNIATVAASGALAYLIKNYFSGLAAAGSSTKS